jgi:hypothetical protein
MRAHPTDRGAAEKGQTQIPPRNNFRNNFPRHPVCRAITTDALQGRYVIAKIS